MKNIDSVIINKEDHRISQEKQELLNLEAEGKYVFHGTGADVEMLEPRQAVDTRTGSDGDPGVFASDKSEYAIFMAIVNKYNCPLGSHSRAGATGKGDGLVKSFELNFGMTKKTSDQLQESASGFVCVFDKSKFVPHRTKEGVEFVAHTNVVPVRKIKVLKRDLPERIEIFEP